MRIIDYLDSLNWTQTRLAAEAKVSVSTVQRLVQAKPISRQNADKICDALSQAMDRKVNLHDVNEIHVSAAERPQRRKAYREAQASPGSDNTEGTTQKVQRGKKLWPLG